MTTEQQILNLLVARAMFDDIPDEWIVSDLHAWTCGTAACFGGWVAVHPYFKAQGARANSYGAPQITGAYRTIEGALFGGDHTLFDSNDGPRSDREEIYHRIETQLNELLDAS